MADVYALMASSKYPALNKVLPSSLCASACFRAAALCAAIATPQPFSPPAMSPTGQQTVCTQSVNQNDIAIDLCMRSGTSALKR
jgi:hypothetical protein